MDPIENCNIPAPSVKKNKKKKKMPPPTEIPQECIDLLSAFPVDLQCTRAKGRHAVAKVALEAGTTVCREKATFHIVRSPFLEKQCHVCLSSLDQETVSHAFTCDSCNTVYYCSQQCMENDKNMHDKMCSVIVRLDDIAKECSVDPDLLRLMLGLMARRAEDATEPSSHNSQKIKPTPFKFVLDLVHNRDKINSDFVDVITEACKPHTIQTAATPSECQS
jgi:hypothetical protein